ncbi:hypothetical protein M0805_005830 [Coniferiporia weirii]|nr:hypothetical protein M0805_005830 [Coniferiporia weirii]
MLFFSPQRLIGLLSVIISCWSPLVSASPISGSASSFGSVISKAGFNWKDIAHVYAFGDSYSFVQGTRGLETFSFIGDLQNISFTEEEFLSDEIVLGSTSSGGANWLEFLIGCFGGRPLGCAARKLWDFAFAGADIDGNLLPLHHPFTVPLVNQVEQWAKYASGFLPHPKPQTLTAWWIGINDTGDSANNASITDFNAFFEEEMNSLFSSVERAYSVGLRGAHLFLTVPPGERMPASLGSPSAPTLEAHVDIYNTLLMQHARTFAQRYASTPVLVFDAHAWFNYALDNAPALGFTNITGFCECTNETGFFWFNSGHPTELVHKLMAEDLNEFLLDAATRSVCTPSSL